MPGMSQVAHCLSPSARAVVERTARTARTARHTHRCSWASCSSTRSSWLLRARTEAMSSCSSKGTRLKARPPTSHTHDVPLALQMNIIMRRITRSQHDQELINCN